MLKNIFLFVKKEEKYLADTLILKWLVAPMNFAINNLPLMTQFATFGETTICLLLLSLSSDLCSLTFFQLTLTLRRKNTDTFASVCSKMAIFKRPENYPKDMQNSLSFHLLIGHIGEASEWVLVTKFPVVLKIRAVKVRPFHFYFIKQVFFAISTLTGCKISASEIFWTKTHWEAFSINARSNRWENEEICIF